jgi:hypothetical protein
MILLLKKIKYQFNNQVSYSVLNKKAIFNHKLNKKVFKIYKIIYYLKAKQKSIKKG